MEKNTDYQLVLNYLKGDEESINELVSKYINPIYRFVLGYVKDKDIAEDITQDVFLKIWKNLKKVKKNKNFKSWVYTIAKNTTLDYLKKKKAIPLSNFENEQGRNIVLEKLLDSSLPPDKLAMITESKRIFKSSLEKLSAKYKEVLSLYYYKYLNFNEIAQKLDEPVNTIKSRHRRGVIMLRKIVDSSAF